MIKSVVFVLRDIGLEGEAEELVSKMREELVKDVATGVCEVVEDRMAVTSEEIENQLKAGLEEIRKVQAETRVEAAPTVEAGELGELTQRRVTQQTTNSNHATYTGKVKMGGRNPHTAVIARSYQKRCQF